MNRTHLSTDFRHVLRLQKMKSYNIVKKAAMHNLREIKRENRSNSNIDPTLSYKNQVLFGKHHSSHVKKDYQLLIEQANLKRKIRKDAVLAIEVLISLPKDHSIDELQFFSDSLDWCKVYFGIPVLSAAIHRDEGSPHCHILLVPIMNSRLLGSKLVGNRTKWTEMHLNYYETVGKKHGMAKPRPFLRHPVEVRRTMAMKTIEQIKNHPILLESSSITDELIDCVSVNPIPLSEAVGVELLPMIQ